MTTARTATTVAGLLTTATLLTSCGGTDSDTFNPTGSGSTPTSTNSSPTESASTPTPTKHPGGAVKVAGEWAEKPARRKVQEAYVAWLQAYADAASIPDPDYQPWVSRMSPKVHQEFRDTIVNMRKQDLVQKGPIRVHPRVSVVRESKAWVQDCMDQTGIAFYRNGKVAKQNESELVPVRVKLTYKDERWILSSWDSVDEGQCDQYEGS